MESSAKKLKTLQEWPNLGERLFEVAALNDLEKTEALIAAGAPLNYCAPGGYTALTYASEFRLLRIVKVLLAAGANPDGVTINDFSALGLAVWRKHMDVVAVLIRAGANLYHVDCHGHTILMDAANDFQAVHAEVVAMSELIVEKMLSIPNANQKKRLYTFMNCMKKLHPVQYPNIRNFFRPALRAMIRQENAPRAREEILKIKREEIRQHLLNKFFPEDKQCIMCTF